MAKASNIPEDDAWLQAYRARRAALPPGGTINGMPVREALGATPAQVAARNPVLPAPGVRQIPAVTPEQADRAMVAAEQIGARRAEEQADTANSRRDRYNAFLEEQGINPNTIGVARLTGRSSNRSLDNPSLIDQRRAVGAANMANAQEGSLRAASIAARRRGNPVLGMELLDQAQSLQEMQGGRSYEANRAWWQEQFAGNSPFREYMQRRANGFY